MPDAAHAAIEEALRRNWHKAIELNKAILKENPHNIEALNRLAFALSESGRIKEAKHVYNKVLTLNRFNPIALKNIKRIALLKGKKYTLVKEKKSKPHQLNDSLATARNNSFSGLFLEEVGKTKVVSLIHIAEAKIISTLHPTNPVILVARRRGITITTADGVYIGALPDDIARRLYVLITGGNRYEAYMKSVDRNEISIFIRELVRQKKFRNQPSFLGKGSAYYPFVRDEVLADTDKPDVSRLEDLDEEEEGTEESAEEEEVS